MAVAAFVAVAVVAAPIAAAADRPSRRGPLHDDTVTVGSFDFAESRLLAEIYSEALEAQGVAVRRHFGVGPREVLLPALAGGLVEFVPEYAGTALRFTSLGADDGADPDAARAGDSNAVSTRSTCAHSRPHRPRMPTRSWSHPRPQRATASLHSVTSLQWRGSWRSVARPSAPFAPCACPGSNGSTACTSTT